MSGMRSETMQLTIESIVRAQLPTEMRDAPFGPQDDLFERGLDSLGVAAVLMEIERTFGVNVPERFISAECFESLAAINAWLAILVGGPCASS